MNSSEIVNCGTKTPIYLAEICPHEQQPVWLFVVQKPVARPPKSPDDRASEAFRIRLTAAEREQLDAQAAAAGVTLSQLIRAAVLGYRLPSPPVTREAVNELRAIGVNLNQIARHANATGALRGDLDETLAEVRQAISELIGRA